MKYYFPDIYHLNLDMHAKICYIACRRKDMPTLQVRDLPDDIYFKLQSLAHSENRSLAQETVNILREGLKLPKTHQARRKAVINDILNNSKEVIISKTPVEIIREQRDK